MGDGQLWFGGHPTEPGSAAHPGIHSPRDQFELLALPQGCALASMP